MEEDTPMVYSKKKTFTRWCNTILSKRGMKLNNCREDLSDGILLCSLLEELSGKKIEMINTDPKQRIHKIENVSKALKLIENEGVKTVNVGAEDIVDGNQKLILGLLWQMIDHYHVRVHPSNESNQKELLDWVRKKIPTYKINNFTYDWSNGKALCALVEALLPGQLNLPNDFMNDSLKDCRMGILKAKENMGIPDIIDAEDMVMNPDDLSIMTYLSSLRRWEKNENTVKEATSRLTRKIDNLKLQDALSKVPAPSECIAIGPGLNPPLEVGIETNFTVEIRNALGRKIVINGGLSIVISNSVTPQIHYSVVDAQDGTFYVTYTPPNPGNQTISIKLNGENISGSPLTICINSAPTIKITKPVQHWFYEANDRSKRIIQFPDSESNIIEELWIKSGGVGRHSVKNNQFTIDFSEMKMLGQKKEKWRVLRGTWFWQENDNTWIPYENDIAMKLEDAMQRGVFLNAQVEITKKPPRHVVMHPDKTFKQYRATKKGNPEGRPVQRGHKGQLSETVAFS